MTISSGIHIMRGHELLKRGERVQHCFLHGWLSIFSQFNAKPNVGEQETGQVMLTHELVVKVILRREVASHA